MPPGHWFYDYGVALLTVVVLVEILLVTEYIQWKKRKRKDDDSP